MWRPGYGFGTVVMSADGDGGSSGGDAASGESGGDSGAAGDGGDGGKPGNLLDAANAGGDGGSGGESGGQGGDGSGETGGEASWFHADGVAGEGDAPDWFRGDKYKTVAEQAKAYNKAAKKLGSFTGAPEGDYELNLPDGFEGAWDDQNPLLQRFQTIARDAGMNQEGFDQFAALAVEFMSVDNEISMEQELAALGENAAKRIRTLAAYAQANMPEDVYKDFESITDRAAGVRVMEWLASRDRQAPLPRLDGSAAPAGETRAEIEKLMDDPRYKTDAAFHADVTKRFEKLVGTGDNVQVVG